MAMTPKEMIEVLQHFVDGGEVEYRDDDGIWKRNIMPVWNFGTYDYRRKPKPLELWGNASPDNYFVPHGDKKEAEDHCALGWRVVLMREVLGD